MRRIKRGRSVFAALVLAGVLVGCGGSDDTGSSGGGDDSGYPQDIRDTFTSNCVSSAEASSGGVVMDYEALCECVLGKIEDQYTLAEFVEAEQAMSNGDSGAIDLQALVADCM